MKIANNLFHSGEKLEQRQNVNVNRQANNEAASQQNNILVPDDRTQRILQSKGVGRNLDLAVKTYQTERDRYAVGVSAFNPEQQGDVDKLEYTATLHACGTKLSTGEPTKGSPNACGTKGCAGVACGGQACGAKACAGNACGVAGCGGNACAANACGLELCLADACSPDACLVDVFAVGPSEKPSDDSDNGKDIQQIKEAVPNTRLQQLLEDASKELNVRPERMDLRNSLAQSKLDETGPNQHILNKLR